MDRETIREFCREYMDDFTSLDNYLDKLGVFFDEYDYPRNVSKRMNKVVGDLRSTLTTLKEEGYAASTRKNFKWGAIGLISEHIMINTKKIDKRLDTITVDELGDKSPTKKMIRRIVEYVPDRIGAFILAMESSGARPVELLRLKKDAIKTELNPARANVYDDKASHKREIHKWIFFTDECINFLKNHWSRENWVTRKRSMGWDRDTITIKTGKGETENVNEEDLLFPFSLASIESHWNDALDNIDTPEGVNATKELERGRYNSERENLNVRKCGQDYYCKKYRLYTLRKRWMTIIGGNVEKEMHVNALMAHLSDLESKYTDFSPRELANAYNKARDDLVIGV